MLVLEVGSIAFLNSNVHSLARFPAKKCEPKCDPMGAQAGFNGARAQQGSQLWRLADRPTAYLGTNPWSRGPSGVVNVHSSERKQED